MESGDLVVVGMMGKIGLPMSALKSKINFFYLLAFLPLVLIGYYKFVSGVSVLGVLIPFYGFLLLFSKKDRLWMKFDGFLGAFGAFFRTA